MATNVQIQPDRLDVIDLAQVYAASGQRVGMSPKMVNELCALARFGITAKDTIEALAEDGEDLQREADALAAEVAAIRARNDGALIRIAIWFTLSGIFVGIAVGEILRDWSLL